MRGARRWYSVGHVEKCHEAIDWRLLITRVVGVGVGAGMVVIVAVVIIVIINVIDVKVGVLGRGSSDRPQIPDDGVHLGLVNVGKQELVVAERNERHLVVVDAKRAGQLEQAVGCASRRACHLLNVLGHVGHLVRPHAMFALERHQPLARVVGVAASPRAHCRHDHDQHRLGTLGGVEAPRAAGT